MCNACYFLAPVFGPVLKFIYDLVNNYGIAIIVFSVIVKLLTFPLSIKQHKSTVAMKKLQPELDKLQKKYGNDKEKLQKEQMELYSKYNINPMAGCLPLLIQMPVLFGLYNVIQHPLSFIAGLSEEVINEVGVILGYLEKEIPMKQIEIAEALNKPEVFEKVKDIIPDFTGINFDFLGLNLADTPEFSFSGISLLWIIPVLSGLTAYLSMIITTKTTGAAQSEQANQMKGMMYMMPIMSVYFCFILPCGMGIYWIISNIMAILQQLVLSKFFGNGKDDVIEVSAIKKK